MALSRTTLKEMGLTDEQVDSIVEMNAASIAGLKAQRDNYKEIAEKYDTVKSELDALKNGEDWKAKYDKLNTDFENYKGEITAKEVHGKKMNAYRNLLKDVKVDEKRIDTILRATKIDDLELDDKGSLKDIDKLKETATNEWKDFITTVVTDPADVETPPTNTGGKITKEQFEKMGYLERNELYMKDKALYESLK